MLDVRPRCFVLMPFRDDLANVYANAIRPAAESEGFICERADEIMRPGVVLEQIDEKIDQASVVVADLTDRNANVMQEYGYARRARKEIVLITQERPSSLPFDVRHYRILIYQQSEDGLVALRDSLAHTLATIRGAGFSAHGDAPREFLQVGYDWFKANIEPQLIKDGYVLVYAGIPQADQYRLEGWEYVTLVDPHDNRTKIVRTQDLIPLRKRK